MSKDIRLELTSVQKMTSPNVYLTCAVTKHKASVSLLKAWYYA